MKAAVLHGVRRIELAWVDLPEVGPNDVLLKIKAVGICGSDVHSYRAGLYTFPNQILGHEFCGEVVKVGKAVEGIVEGDRGTGFTFSYCGSCYWCKAGEYRLCPQLFKGYSGYGKPGAMAEYMLIENARLNVNFFKIPPTLSDEVAATAEPLGVAIYTMYRTGPKKNDKVVILGAGIIGNLIMQVMKTVPVSKVIVTEVSKERLRMAKKMGADVAIDAKEEENLLGLIKEHTGMGEYHFGTGGMADIVIDAAGAPTTLKQALEFVRSQGTIGLVGLPEKDVLIDTTKIVHKDIRVVGILGSAISEAVEYLDKGLVQTAPLITHHFSLDEIVSAFDAIASDPAAIKVMIHP
jgi:2-desacetyl-2-hydroxyethyl bacteriochlorophyllide A dehydrogenase